MIANREICLLVGSVLLFEHELETMDQVLTLALGRLRVTSGGHMSEPGVEREKALIDEFQHKLARVREHLRVLLDCTNALSAQVDLHGLFTEMSKYLRQLLHHEMTVLALYDPKSNLFQAFTTGKGTIFESVTLPVEGTPEGMALISRKPVLRECADFIEEGLQSGCVAPLLVREKVIGTLTVASARQSAFTEDDVDLLVQIAVHVAIAVENVRNLQSARVAQQQVARERDRSKLLLEVNNAVVSHLDLKELVKSISLSLRRVIPNDAAFLTLYDCESDLMRVQALDIQTSDTIPFEEEVLVPMSGTPEERAIRSRQPALVSHADLAKSPSAWVRHAIENGIRSGCAAPLISRNRPLGALSVVSLRDSAFNENDAELLGQIAGQVAISVENALAFNQIAELKDRLAEEKFYLEDEIRNEYFDEIIGDSAPLNAVLEQVQTVAATDATVLILGETGTGKELIARAIHNQSPRNTRTFVKLNCSAIPTGLLESELFGHEKGAFTGAIAQRIGRLELADKGTLFLDEIGDIPLELQPKLLRSLQESEFERLGSSRTQKVNLRLIAATNRDLPQMVAMREFRSDLFYRLNVFPVTVPPLRQRPGDIPRLVRHFVGKYALRMNRNIETIPTATMRSLEEWHWPGNVRELENFIERAVILTKGSALNAPVAELRTSSTVPIAPIKLIDSEREHILRVLRETRGVLSGPSGAADRLGLKRGTLQGKMKKLGISREDWLKS